MLISLFFICIPTNNLYASEYAKEYKLLEVYLEENGLIPSTYSISQDSTGFIWFGTNEGLFRYDGRRLKGYLHTDSENFIRKRINQIIPSGTTLWIIAENELYKFHTINDSIIHCFSNPENNTNLLEFRMDKKENLWIRTTESFYVLKSVCDSMAIFEVFEETKQQSGNLTGIQVDETGQAWMMTADGIYPVSYTNENLVTIGKNLLPKERITNEQYREFAFKDDYLFVTTKNDLLIYRIEQNGDNYSAILFKHIPDEIIFPQTPQKELSLVNIYEFIIDNNYNVLLDTELGLVMINSSIQDDASIHVINHKSGQNILYVASMFQDKMNNIFVGLGEQGVGYINLDNREFKMINYPISAGGDNSGYSSPVNNLIEDKEGNIWFSSLSLGLLKYSPSGTVEHVLKTEYEKELEISDYRIQDMEYGKGDQIYIATFSGLDVFSIESGKVRPMYLSNEDPLSQVILDLAIDDWNRVWTLVENPYGLHRISYQEKRASNPLVEDMNYLYSFSKDSSFRETNRLFYNSGGQELLICQPRGLWRIRFDSTGEIYSNIYYELAKLDPRGSYETFFINDIAFGENSKYYLATNGQGLILVELLDEIDKEGYGVYESDYLTMDDGLRSNFINSVLIDADGFIWIAGRGLMRRDMNTGDIIDYSNVRHISQTLFIQASAIRSKDDKLYFGSTNSVIYIDPSGYKDIRPLIKPVITDIKVGMHELATNKSLHKKDIYPDKEIAYSSELRLNYSQNGFVAEFAGLNFLDPELVNYQFMLSEFDEDWIQVKNSASCSYTNLKPGTYDLMVRVSGQNGIWNPVPAILTVRVLPPWYFHPLAYLSYFLLFVAITIIIVRLIIIRQGMILNKKLYEHRIQLFTNICHELQTPISLITSPLEDLMKMKLSAEATRLVSLANRNSKRIFALNNELMEVRKSESGNLQVVYEQSNVNALIRKTADLFIPVSNELGIEYNIIIPEEEICTYIDHEKTVKIIINLLSNAFKFTNQGGAVTISLLGPSEQHSPNTSMNNQFIIPSQIKTGEFVTVSILDTGRGIHESDLSKIFSRFFRSESSDRIGRTGFGIGLSIVKNLAELIRAELVVASKPGIGSEFTVKFPIEDHQLKKEKGKELSESLQQEFLTLEHNILIEEFHPNHTEENIDLEVNMINRNPILVVEDNKELLDYLAHRLSLYNYKIIKAENGVVALEQLESINPELIITDWLMPDMNGLELIRKLKSNPETTHIPVIMLTNKFEIENNLNATIAGADYYISKPINMEFLLAKIRTIIDHSQKLKRRFARDVFFDVKTNGLSISDREFLDKVVKLILNNVENLDFDSKSIYSSIGMSKSPFYDRIKALTGQSPADFIKTLKLKLAARILIEEGISVQEVTYRVGIENQSYFSQIFKKQFGKSPSEFVKSYSAS